MMKHLMGSVLLLSSSIAQAGLLELFQGHYGALEIYDERAKLSFRVNAAALTAAAPACGLHRLDQALVALSQNKVQTSARIEWPEANFPANNSWPSAWKQPQDVRTALKRQTPWFFDALQLTPGASTLSMKQSGGKIAPLTVVDWFKQLKLGGLPHSKAAQTQLIAALQNRGIAKGYQLVSYGSQCDIGDGLAQSWNVGYVVHPQGTAYFAVLMEGKSRVDLLRKAPRLRDAALKQLKYLPETQP